MKAQQIKSTDIARAKKLYENVQKKQEELKLAKKAYKKLRKKILNEFAKPICDQHSDVDLEPYHPGEAICAKFCLTNGLHYHLAVNFLGKSIDCYARIVPADFLSQTNDQFMDLAHKFIDVFKIYRGKEIMYSSFLPYQYKEAFDCFNKAYDKFIEIGAEAAKK